MVVETRLAGVEASSWRWFLKSVLKDEQALVKYQRSNLSVQID